MPNRIFFYINDFAAKSNSPWYGESRIRRATTSLVLSRGTHWSTVNNHQLPTDHSTDLRRKAKSSSFAGRDEVRCKRAGAAEWILRWGGLMTFFWPLGGLRSFFPEILLGEKGVFCNFSQSWGGWSPPSPPLPPPMSEYTNRSVNGDDILAWTYRWSISELHLFSTHPHAETVRVRPSSARCIRFDVEEEFLD